jgi:hypothetical protein
VGDAGSSVDPEVSEGWRERMVKEGREDFRIFGWRMEERG